MFSVMNLRFVWHSLCMLGLPALLIATSMAHAAVFDGEELRDPTRPDGALVEAAGEEGLFSSLFGSGVSLLNSGYRVSFIRAGGSEPVAMVNNQLVRRGDMIGTAQVLSIDTDSVSLQVNGVVQKITSFDMSLKSPVEAQ